MSLDELLKTADYVSLNVPLKADTRGMIGERELSLMKKSAFIINAARGPVWQEKAVFKALSENWIAGAAADVFEEEPTAHDNPLLGLENFIGTPHVAAHTQDAMQRMAMVVEDIVSCDPRQGAEVSCQPAEICPADGVDELKSVHRIATCKAVETSGVCSERLPS